MKISIWLSLVKQLQKDENSGYFHETKPVLTRLRQIDQHIKQIFQHNLMQIKGLKACQTCYTDKHIFPVLCLGLKF